MNLDTCIEIGNRILAKNKYINPGLINGKVGISIFLYHLYQKTLDQKYNKLANELLDNLNITFLPPSFYNGFTGIGFSYEYLILNKFCSGNNDLILEEIDNRIFKIIRENETLSIDLQSGLLGYLTYLIFRVQSGKEKHNTIYRINVQLLRKIINDIDEKAPETLINMPKDIKFDLFWNVTALFRIIHQAFKLNVYNEKIRNMLNQWMFYLHSYMPGLHIHRLHLALALQEINTICQSEELAKQIKNILYATSTEKIYSELNFQKNGLQEGCLGFVFLVRKACLIFDKNYPNYIHFLSLGEKLLNLFDENIEKQLKNTKNNMTDEMCGISEGWSGAGLLFMLCPEIFSKTK